MKELRELTEALQTSRPIFKLTLRSNQEIDTEVAPEALYRPKPIEGNILSEMICSEYRESFDLESGKFTIDKIKVANDVMHDIRQAMSQFLEHNLTMKKPKQSKIWHWYRHNLPTDDDFNDVLVMLYKYMRTFCDSNMIAFTTAEDIGHTDNTIALLEAIMEKFDEQK